ncbi:ADP-ribosylarginine hydrolase Tri1-like isoform X2 [Corticium candelabrum]|nr:ADP-ribosylarginine hydrolase Tri1-like isoform X2 [Corticium candelabrum]
MHSNRFSVLPLCVCHLRELVKLDVSGNQLQSMPRELVNLRCLRYLNISNNVISEFTLSADQACQMEVIMATFNRCQNPPQEVCNQGSKAIMKYFQEKCGDPKSREKPSATRPAHTANEFPRQRGSISQDIIDAQRSPSGKPTSRQLQRAPLQEATRDSKLEGKVLADKICGLFYGAALGDAIGLCTEFLSEEQCHFHYDMEGLSYQSMIRDRHRCKWRPGDWTDDTDQMIIILDSLLLWGGVVDELDFAARLSQWSKHGFPELGDTVGWGIGRTVGKCIDHKDYLKNPHEVAQKVWNSIHSAANGAVMRTAVLGIPRFNNLSDVSESAVRICKATHYDPRCQASCIAVCAIVALMLQGNHDLNDPKSLEDLLHIASDTAHGVLKSPDHIKDFAHYTSTTNFDSINCSEPDKIGYTLKPLGAAYAALRLQSDFKTIISDLVMRGGDADTNAVVAGAVLGCKLGYSCLPSDWLQGLLSKQKTWLNAKLNCLLDLMALP